MGKVLSILCRWSPSTLFSRGEEISWFYKKTLNELELPDATSPDLQLIHPTEEENISIWNLTSDSWKEALTVPLYLEESAHLRTVPLARNGGMTNWVLVDKSDPPQGRRRRLLASCETYRKRSLISDTDGNVTEAITHGVASVYCDPRYRGRGYASRLLRELAAVLPSWQTETFKCVASVLFSDIGKRFYGDLGWHPFPSNHIRLDPIPVETPGATQVMAEDLEQLCREDEALVRKAMSTPSSEKTRFTIVPDCEHMRWHHAKEEFLGRRALGREPRVKGAIVGEPGKRIWVIWTHRFYEPPETPETASNNTLYILRLVIEDQAPQGSVSGEAAELQTRQLQAVLQAAQAEAADWQLQHVVIWGVSSQAQELIERTGIPYVNETREDEGICCLKWYGQGDGKRDSLDWIGNEKYGWC